MYVYVCIYWIFHWLLWFPWQLKERAEQLVKDRITFIIYMYMCIYVCIYIHIYVYLYMYILNYLLIALASLAVERTRRTTGKGPHHRRPAPSVAGQVWLEKRDQSGGRQRVRFGERGWFTADKGGLMLTRGRRGWGRGHGWQRKAKCLTDAVLRLSSFALSPWHVCLLRFWVSPSTPSLGLSSWGASCVRYRDYNMTDEDRYRV